MRSVVERDIDCGGGVVSEGGDARLAAGAREGADGSQPGTVDNIPGVDAVGVGPDVGRGPATTVKARPSLPESLQPLTRIAYNMLQGCDVWPNTPLPPQEAPAL